MIIAITTVAAIAAIIFGAIQTNKLKKITEDLSNKDAANKILRAHMTNVESEVKASADYIKTLRSELQSCTDKAKAAKAKTQPKTNSTLVEKAAPAMTSTKTKRPYKKKGA